MFSVIVPLYNKSAYIEKCLESVLNQTFLDFEVIIVNDGSTDDGPDKVKNLIKKAPELCPRITAKNIKLIDQPNLGVSTARNNGVKAAKNDLVAFLDADDWWDVHFLEEMQNLIKEFPEAGVYGSSFFIVKNSIYRKANIGLPPEFKKGYINYFQTYANTFCTPFNCSFVVIKKSVFNIVGRFNPRLTLGEDFDLWVRVALKYKVGYINKQLAFSNQNVEIVNRAVDPVRIYHPETYTTFNWDYLSLAEQENGELKKILDHLRMISLLRYHLAGKYINETTRELAKVDFSKQPAHYKRLYSYPRFIIKAYFGFLKTGSKLKQHIIKITRN